MKKLALILLILSVLSGCDSSKPQPVYKVEFKQIWLNSLREFVILKTDGTFEQYYWADRENPASPRVIWDISSEDEQYITTTGEIIFQIHLFKDDGKITEGSYKTKRGIHKWKEVE